MNYLLIDTSSSHVLVSIISNYKIIENYNGEVLDDISSKILPIIDKCIKKCNLTIRDLDKIFIVNGPGSFTGVRIGVTIAKIISWSLNIDLIKISSLELLASSSDSNKIIPLINARRGNVYSAVYDSNLNVLLKEQMYSLDYIVNKYKDAVFVSFDAFDNIKVTKPNYNIIKLIKKHEKDTPVNPHKLIPNYLKKTEAEEKLYDKAV